MSRDRTADFTPSVIGAILVVLLAAGPFIPQWAIFIITIAFAKGLVALGLMLLLRAGLISFGQALYYCLGAYAAGALGRFMGISDVLAQMLAGALVAGFAAFILGFLLAKYRGIFFGLLSLALSMILYGLLVKNEALGSTDGFNILPSTLFGGAAWTAVGSVCRSRQRRHRLASSCLGSASLSRHAAWPPRARDQGQRNPRRVHGRLRAPCGAREVRDRRGARRRRRRARGDYGGAHRSGDGVLDDIGEFIFITILAGTGSVVAPFAGALIYGVIHTTAYDLSPNTWQMSLGLALLLIIVFLPEGLWSMFRRRYARHP